MPQTPISKKCPSGNWSANDGKCYPKEEFVEFGGKRIRGKGTPKVVPARASTGATAPKPTPEPAGGTNAPPKGTEGPTTGNAPQTPDTLGGKKKPVGGAGIPKPADSRARTSEERSREAGRPSAKPKDQPSKKPKGSTARRIITEYAGDANAFFSKEAKRRFRTGLPCPFRESNACYVWSIPNKVMAFSYNAVSGLYEKAQRIKDEKQKEATSKGYDDAMDYYDELVPVEGGKAYKMSNMQEIDRQLVGRGKEIVDKYGMDTLRNPVTNDQRRARAEYQTYYTLWTSMREESKRMRAQSLAGGGTSTTNTSGGTPRGKPTTQFKPGVKLQVGSKVTNVK